MHKLLTQTKITLNIVDINDQQAFPVNKKRGRPIWAAPLLIANYSVLLLRLPLNLNGVANYKQCIFVAIILRIAVADTELVGSILGQFVFGSQVNLN